MSADYTISDPRFGFDGYPFLFVRVHDRPELGTCAVQGYNTDLGVFLIPNVTPVDVDAYEAERHVLGVWKQVHEVYGVSWTDEKSI